jgi:hypothetical protein
LVFPVVSFLLVFPPISYMHSSSLPFVLYAPPVSSFTITHIKCFLKYTFSQGIYFKNIGLFIRQGPRPLLNIRNKLIFYGDELLAPCPTLKLEDHPLSAVRDGLFNTFAVALHNWRASPPSATWGRVMPWWQRTRLTWLL